MNLPVSEYETLINSLKRELSVYKNEQEDLRNQLLKLVSYNRNITIQLKETINQRMNDEMIIKNLQQQLEVSLEFQDSVKEKVLSRSSEADACQDVSGLRRHFETKLEGVMKQYKKGMEHLTNDLLDAQKQIETLKMEKGNITQQLNICKTDLQRVVEDGKSKEALSINQIHEIEGLQKKVLTIEELLLDNEKLMNNLKKENADLKTRNYEVLDKNEVLSGKISQLENEISLLEKKSKEDYLEAQHAILEVKALTVKNNLAKSFEENLKLSIKQQIEHATQKYKQDTKMVKKEWDKKISCLEQEISDLQLENSRKQVLFEKSVREKDALESKLKALKVSENVFVSTMVFDDICHKLSQSEKARDEALLRVQSLESTLHDLQQCKSKDLQYLTNESKTLKLQLDMQTQELNHALEDRLKMSRQMEELKNKCSLLEKQLLVYEMQKEQQIQALKERLIRQRQSVEHQLQRAGEKYDKDLSDIHQLLDSQYTINRKWKKALEELTVKSESKIKVLLQDMMLLKQQKDRLHHLLKSK